MNVLKAAAWRDGPLQACRRLALLNSPPIADPNNSATPLQNFPPLNNSHKKRFEHSCRPTTKMSSPLTNGYTPRSERIAHQEEKNLPGGWVVLKFGGTSVGKFAENIAAIVQ